MECHVWTSWETYPLHDSHDLVVRTLDSGAGDSGSDPGGVSCGVDEEILWKVLVMHGIKKVCETNWNYLIICSQKCHLNLLKF